MQGLRTPDMVSYVIWLVSSEVRPIDCLPRLGIKISPITFPLMLVTGRPGHILIHCFPLLGQNLNTTYPTG
uniref:Uncharacterized protein n=1 Tax=Anguilla anguilla TaxID=7936 RepID=A0A0E9VU30_ANGAN